MTFETLQECIFVRLGLVRAVALPSSEEVLEIENST